MPELAIHFKYKSKKKMKAVSDAHWILSEAGLDMDWSRDPVTGKIDWFIREDRGLKFEVREEDKT